MLIFILSSVSTTRSVISYTRLPPSPLYICTGGDACEYEDKQPERIECMTEENRWACKTDVDDDVFVHDIDVICKENETFCEIKYKLSFVKQDSEEKPEKPQPKSRPWIAVLVIGIPFAMFGILSYLFGKEPSRGIHRSPRFFRQGSRMSSSPP